MSKIFTVLLFLIFAFVISSSGLPLGGKAVSTYSIATGRGSLLRPGFDDSLTNYVKRDVNNNNNNNNNNNDIIDAEESAAIPSDDDVLDFEKRSVALGRSLFRPAKRSMAMGRSGFRPGKRSIATGRSGFRPGKRAAALSENGGNISLKDTQTLLMLQQLLDEEIAETNRKISNLI